MKILGFWALCLVVGFIGLKDLGPHSTDRLAEQLVTRLTALDKRQLAFCYLARAYCESAHKGITEFIATIQKAKHDGNDAELRRLKPLVNELEALMIPELRGLEEIQARVQRTLQRQGY